MTPRPIPVAGALIRGCGISANVAPKGPRANDQDNQVVFNYADDRKISDVHSIDAQIIAIRRTTRDHRGVLKIIAI